MLSAKIEGADSYEVGVNANFKELSGKGSVIFTENNVETNLNILEVCVKSIGDKTGRLINLHVEKIVEGNIKNADQPGSNSAIVITIDNSYKIFPIVENGQHEMPAVES